MIRNLVFCLLTLQLSSLAMASGDGPGSQSLDYLTKLLSHSYRIIRVCGPEVYSKIKMQKSIDKDTYANLSPACQKEVSDFRQDPRILAGNEAVVKMVGKVMPGQRSLTSSETFVAEKEAERFYREYLVSREHFTYSDLVNKANAATEEQVDEVYDSLIAQDAGHEALTDVDRKKFTAQASNSEVTVQANHPLFKRLAGLLTQTAHTDVQKLVSIHNFVIWRMTYWSIVDGSPVSTLKKKWAACADASQKAHWYGWIYQLPPECGITAPFDTQNDRVLYSLYSGVGNCYDYAFLFTSLARAAGIPTREVREPWKCSNRECSGHQWVQVFVSGGWRVIDPTFDDVYDQGQYGDDAAMAIDFEYFLISPDAAASLDPADHAKYEIENI